MLATQTDVRSSQIASSLVYQPLGERFIGNLISGGILVVKVLSLWLQRSITCSLQEQNAEMMLSLELESSERS